MSKDQIIDRDTVLHVARLAQLELSESEIGYYAEQLEKIIGYVDLLKECDLSKSLRSSEVNAGATPERKDISEQRFSVEELLEQAPAKIGSAFQVPRIIEA